MTIQDLCIVILSNAWLIPQLCLCYPPYLLWHSPMFCDHRSLFLCVWSHHEWGCPWAKTLHGQKFLYHCLLHMLAWCSFFICLAVMTQIIKITAKSFLQIVSSSMALIFISGLKIMEKISDIMLWSWLFILMCCNFIPELS